MGVIFPLERFNHQIKEHRKSISFDKYHCSMIIEMTLGWVLKSRATTNIPVEEELQKTSLKKQSILFFYVIHKHESYVST